MTICITCMLITTLLSSNNRDDDASQEFHQVACPNKHAAAPMRAPRET